MQKCTFAHWLCFLFLWVVEIRNTFEVIVVNGVIFVIIIAEASFGLFHVSFGLVSLSSRFVRVFLGSAVVQQMIRREWVVMSRNAFHPPNFSGLVPF